MEASDALKGRLGASLTARKRTDAVCVGPRCVAGFAVVSSRPVVPTLSIPFNLFFCPAHLRPAQMLHVPAMRARHVVAPLVRRFVLSRNQRGARKRRRRGEADFAPDLGGFSALLS
jgi:hypothetical protein